jgi:hypothetical protein
MEATLDFADDAQDALRSTRIGCDRGAANAATLAVNVPGTRTCGLTACRAFALTPVHLPEATTK